MSPKFDARAEIAQGTVDVTLPDGSEWKGVLITPGVRRELQKVDVSVAENAKRLSSTVREQRKLADDGAPDGYGPEELQSTLKDVNTVSDAVYAKVRLLLVGAGGKGPTQDQVLALGDTLAVKLLDQLRGEEEDPTPPAGTTGM